MRFASSRRCLACVAVLLAALLWGCVRNPVTQRLQFALITEAQEIEMGREGAAEVERSLGLVPDPALQKYMQAQFPSQIEPDELAIINGVASAGSVLPAGSRVKRVAGR